MLTVIFDIETVGHEFDSLDSMSQEYFLRFAETEPAKEEARNSLSFFPLTAQIVAIGLLEVETDKGFVFYQNCGSLFPEKLMEGDTTFQSGSEKEILKLFWEQLKKYNCFVTFNGRVFDCPFLMLRSAINQIRPTRNLMPYRYQFREHVDLADQLSFYDALRRKFSLHMWCQAFGIPSPKEGGVTGLMVKDMFKQGKCLDIARYCLCDVKATKALYLLWDQYIKFL